MRNFGQAMAVSTVLLLTALLQRHLVVLAISSYYRGEYCQDLKLGPNAGAP